MSFNPVTTPVDYVLFAGKKTPGLCDILGAGSPRQWEKRKGYALGGSFLIYRGIDLTPFVVSIRLYSSQDWDDWHEFAPVVQRPPIDLAARRVARTAPSIGAGVAGAGARAGSGQQNVFPFRGERPRALDVWHPILEDLGIRSCVVENLRQPRQTADGEWTIEIACLEYRRPQLAIARPDGSQARPPSTDPVDRQIEQLTAQLQELAAS